MYSVLSYSIKLCVTFQTLHLLVTHPARSDGNWGLWSPWSACTTTCGDGNITRVRLCNNPRRRREAEGARASAERRSLATTRSAQVTTHTHTQSVPTYCTIVLRWPATNLWLRVVAGGWTTWSEWSLCSQSCGGGLVTRRRECLNPAPQNGGKPCAGDPVDYEACNKQPCPIGKLCASSG